VISSSDQQVVIALRLASQKIVVPPESRWLRERRSYRAEWMMATVAIAIVALIAVLGALRSEPRMVPGSVPHTQSASASGAASTFGPVTFDLSDDTPWLVIRAKAAPDIVVLRPTWLPRTSDSASTCEMTLGLYGDEASSEAYHVHYVDSRPTASLRPCSLSLGGDRNEARRRDVAGFAPVLATFPARGTVVDVRQNGDTLFLGWLENGVFYEVIAEGFRLSDLVHVVNSLDPVQ
jgi:hypothetical protein